MQQQAGKHRRKAEREHRAGPETPTACDQHGGKGACNEFHRQWMKEELEIVGGVGTGKAGERAACHHCGPYAQQPWQETPRHQHQDGKDEIEVHLMHQGPSEPEDRDRVLGQQQIGIDQVQPGLLCHQLAAPHRALHVIGHTVSDKEIARHDQREEPPDGVDPGGAGKQEGPRCRE